MQLTLASIELYTGAIGINCKLLRQGIKHLSKLRDLLRPILDFPPRVGPSRDNPSLQAQFGWPIFRLKRYARSVLSVLKSAVELASAEP